MLKSRFKKPYRLISAEKDKARGAEKRAIGPMGQKIGFLKGLSKADSKNLSVDIGREG